MSSALTTVTRFKAYAGITGSSGDSLITALIPQVSDQIERYLRRTLASTTYKVWINGSGAEVLRLVQYPITALYQVSVGANSVALVANNSDAVSRATVSCDGTNVVLVEISTLGVDTVTVLPVATYKTIGAMATQINTLPGWSCTVNGVDGQGLPSSFLRPIYSQDATGANADLIIPDKAIQAKIYHEDMITIINSDQFPTWDIFPMDRQPNRMSAIQPGITPPTFSYGFPPGDKNIFVWFKAGYDLPTDAVPGNPGTPASDGTLPGGLELVVHQIIYDVMASTKINSNMQSESIGDYSYSLRASQKGAVGSSIQNRKLDLNQYRKVAI